MGETSKFFDLLKALAEQLPSLIAMLACIGFAINRRRRYPKVALTVIIGLALLILHTFVFNIIYTWVPGWFIKADNYDAVTARNVYLVLGLINNTCAALIMGLLLAAVFIDRNRDARLTDRGSVGP